MLLNFEAIKCSLSEKSLPSFFGTKVAIVKFSIQQKCLQIHPSSLRLCVPRTMRSDAAKHKDILYLLLRLSLLLTLSQPGASHLGQGDGTEHKARNLPSHHSWAPNQHCDCGQVIRSLWGIKAYLLMKWIGFVLDQCFSAFFFFLSQNYPRKDFGTEV